MLPGTESPQAVDTGGMNLSTDDGPDRSFSTQSEEDQKEGTRISKRWDILDQEAINWKTHWQDCYEMIVPRKEDVIAVRFPGDRRNSDLFDTTAILANEMLASALHGMLTNPEMKFFEITFGDPNLDEDETVKAWCQEVGDRMFRTLNNSNFQTEIYEVYIDQGAIGTACLFMGEDDDNVVQFNARAMKEVRIDENNLGMVDVVYRMFKWRPYQIIQEFGRKGCPSAILRAESSEEQYEVLHAVEPMNAYKGEPDKKDPRGFKFKSTYIMKQTGYILSKSGFREAPYAVPRWSKTTGEKYGRGPGMAMLPDIQMINAMALTVLQGAQMTVNPPLMVEDDGVIGNVRLTPGGLTVVRPGSGAIKPLITDARVDFGQQVLETVRKQIRSGFYVDQFQLAQGPQKTAEEVRAEVEQRLRLMGPVLGRQHSELLMPLITRLFDIMWKKKLLPDAPVKIKGKKFDVKYSSLIARAQRMSEGQNMMRAIQLLQPVMQLDPKAAQGIDTDKVVREVWDIYGLPDDLLLRKADLKKVRDNLQKQQAQMQQQQQQIHQSQVAKNSAPLVQAVAQSQSQPQPQQGAPGVPSQ